MATQMDRAYFNTRLKYQTQRTLQQLYQEKK